MILKDEHVYELEIPTESYVIVVVDRRITFCVKEEVTLIAFKEKFIVTVHKVHK